MAFDSFNPEKEVGKLWRGMHSAQAEIGKAYFRWRKAAVQMAGDGADPREIALRAAEVTGGEIGRALLPRLNWLKGEQGWLGALGKQIASHWINQGALVKVGPGETENELLVTWTRCPWPTYHKDYGAPMEEDVQCCDRILESLMQDVNLFFNVDYKIETLKAIPRGQGSCVRRIYKA